MRSCGLLTLNYIKMTSIDLLKEIESWLSFNTEPSKEETAKLRKSIKEHLAEQLRIHDVVGRSEQLVCDRPKIKWKTTLPCYKCDGKGCYKCK